MRRILFGLALLLSILDDSFGQSSQPPVISNQNAAPTQQHNEGTAGTEDISTKSSNERSNRQYKERWDKFWDNFYDAKVTDTFLAIFTFLLAIRY
jgi:hypothetical protein